MKMEKNELRKLVGMRNLVGVMSSFREPITYFLKFSMGHTLYNFTRDQPIHNALQLIKIFD